MTSDIAKDRTTHLLKKKGSVSSLSSHEFRRKEPHGRPKEWVTKCLLTDSIIEETASWYLSGGIKNTFTLGHKRGEKWTSAGFRSSLGAIFFFFKKEEGWQLNLSWWLCRMYGNIESLCCASGKRIKEKKSKPT